MKKMITKITKKLLNTVGCHTVVTGCHGVSKY